MLPKQGGIITIQNLTSIFGYVKSAWPDGITYYNDQWDVFNDKTWRDGTGEKYGMVPSSLDGSLPLECIGNKLLTTVTFLNTCQRC